MCMCFLRFVFCFFFFKQKTAYEMRISDWSSDVCSSDLLAETPWVMWEDDMTAKSSIKKQAKHLPLTPGDPINAAAALDSRADANVIDMAAMADPDVAREVVENG